MARQEIINRLEQLDNWEFYIMMADFWTAEDKRNLYKIETERKILKAQLEKGE